MNFKKMFKRETRVIAYVVIALTLVVIGTSYALFLQVNNNSNNQVVKAGSLTITYSQTNVTNVSTCIKPQTDAAAATGGCKYTLSITNTGTLPMQYSLTLANVSGSTNLVPYNMMKYTLTKQKTGATAQTLASNTVLGTDTATNRSLHTSTINSGETYTFVLNIWINYDLATVDIINKNVDLKLDVVGIVDEETSLEEL